MSAVLESSRVDDAAALPAADDAEALLRAVRDIADGPLAALADDIDRRGTYPKSVLVALGTAGAFAAHLGGDGRAADYPAAIRAIAEVSRVCGATGFMMWCHAVCGTYMEQSGNPALVGDRLQAHARPTRSAAPA